MDDTGHNLMKVIKTYEKGLVDLVVVYYTIKGKDRKPLVTYDLAHGFPHRDIRYLDDRDKRKKKEIETTDLEEFLETALDDITKNWRRYLKDFEETKR